MPEAGPQAQTDPDLQAMAEDELVRALTLSRREMVQVTPWGDSFDGVSPAGHPVTVERNYLWAEREGGDILVEVVVFGGESRYDHGAKVSRVVHQS